MKMKLEGVISAMMTPFTKGGEFVDFDKVGPPGYFPAAAGSHPGWVASQKATVSQRISSRWASSVTSSSAKRGAIASRRRGPPSSGVAHCVTVAAGVCFMLLADLDMLMGMPAVAAVVHKSRQAASAGAAVRPPRQVKPFLYF